MSEGQVAGAPSEGNTGAPPAAPTNGAGGSVGDAGGSTGAPTGPSSGNGDGSFLSSFSGGQPEGTNGNGTGTPVERGTTGAPGAEAAGQEGGTETARPENLDERFWDAETGKVKVEDLAKSYSQLEHLLGKEKVPVPVDENDEEGIERWINAVRPETPEAYEFTKTDTDVPQGMSYDTQLEESFRNRAHQLGLMPHQARALHEEYFQIQTERYNEYVRMREENRNNLKHELQRQHGPEYPAVERRAKTVMTRFADEGFVEYLNETGLGDDPRMVAFLDRMGRDLDGSPRLVGQAQAQTPTDVQAAIGSFREKNHKALYDAEHPNHKAVVEQMNQLYVQLHGDAPVS